ncbi:MAG: hypothetical protein KAJ03_02895, partial [Gammaproteobacteria bacterium]|nr:hypothetical protein [Gammaproteobacteria bacterium]
GNHDIRNDKGTLGSLDLISKYGSTECLIALADYGKPFFETLDYGGVTVYAVPYQHSQELFDKVLRVVAKQAAPNPNVTILALHCDYDMRFEATDMMQVLTKEAAVEALKSVDHIILGHEHVSATHLDGRLVIAGNIFPTSFSDISNKYVWKFDRGAWSRVQVWNENTAYFSTDANEITASTVLTETCNFVDISGEVKQNQVLPLARIISSWWDKYGDNLCAVRMGFTIEGTKVDKVDYGSDIVSLPDRVRDSLKSNPNMLSLWDEVYSDILKERSDE